MPHMQPRFALCHHLVPLVLRNGPVGRWSAEWHCRLPVVQLPKPQEEQEQQTGCWVTLGAGRCLCAVCVCVCVSVWYVVQWRVARFSFLVSPTEHPRFLGRWAASP
jgi:hypothetical protein